MIGRSTKKQVVNWDAFGPIQSDAKEKKAPSSDQSASEAKAMADRKAAKRAAAKEAGTDDQSIEEVMMKSDLFDREIEGAVKEKAKAEGPATCRAALDMGMELYGEGDFKGALGMFEKSLDLPGSGFMRIAGTVREYACPSEGEEQAALYNMACAYCQMGPEEGGPKVEAALACLKGAVEAGFEDVRAMEQDADLAAAVRAPGFAEKKRKAGFTNKPWLQW
ncbi:unnamed protein product [Pedinophyceae sp. YPF-701]|nr:unnamed protein product [Pedinophyceae sp. YPF-701]